MMVKERRMGIKILTVFFMLFSISNYSTSKLYFVASFVSSTVILVYKFLTMSLC